MIDLDEMERKEQEATPAPWYPLFSHPYLFANARGPKPWHHDIVGRFDYHSEKDRAFIAALRNAAPELIAMARRWQALDKMMQSGPEAHLEVNGAGWPLFVAVLDGHDMQEQKR